MHRDSSPSMSRKNLTPELQAEFLWRYQHGDKNQDPGRMFGIYHLLSQVIVYGVPGDVVEFGCNKGHTSVLLAKTLVSLGAQRDHALALYDSFQGMPAFTDRDAGTHPDLIVPGALKASPQQVIDHFKARGCKECPKIHEGWFQDTIPRKLPEEIAFALLDGDLYESIHHCLRFVWRRMAPGGIVVIDDYGHPGIPGCKLAADEFFADKQGAFFEQWGMCQAFARKGWEARHG